ncbi:MAG: GNAT family N-acetyltransferase [Methanobacteriota archaeon]
MAIRFEEITDKNFHECIDLEVHPEQKDCFYFKSNRPNVMSLAEAHIYKDHKVLAVYDGETMVGTVFYSPENDFGGAWLTRLMIDRRYQGKGHGRRAMEMLIGRIREETHGKCARLGTSYEPDNRIAERLYKSLGFRPSGELLHGQTMVWLKL